MCAHKWRMHASLSNEVIYHDILAQFCTFLRQNCAIIAPKLDFCAIIAPYLRQNVAINHFTSSVNFNQLLYSHDPEKEPDVFLPVRRWDFVGPETKNRILISETQNQNPQPTTENGLIWAAAEAAYTSTAASSTPTLDSRLFFNTVKQPPPLYVAYWLHNTNNGCILNRQH